MRLQRQGQKWHDRKRVLQKIKQEYAVFKYGMLSGTVHEVYDSCRRICFYESLREYFLYNRRTIRGFFEAASGKEGILGELWEMYLKNECLKADTWEEIEAMLQMYVEEHTLQAETEVTG